LQKCGRGSFVHGDMGQQICAASLSLEIVCWISSF